LTRELYTILRENISRCEIYSTLHYPVCDSSVYDAIDDITGEADEPLAVNMYTLREVFTTTYGCGTLVNTARSNDRVETELYDSGASRHMSPYRYRFENYERKPIT
jgi:hypothetical protein